jgi:hypothetical protein
MLIDRVATRLLYSTALVGCVSLLIAVGLSWSGRMPEPRVHDEFSYLLAADTFAHGRLTNPPHPLWQHFESFHIIQQPTYSSKYPVGQGLSMAAGQVLTGRPIVGVWLTVALACMAITWMLAPFVPPRWALAGGLLAAMHPQVMQWEHNYWGGGVAMLGGALLVGAARRFMERPSPMSAAIMTAAGIVLANSRPFEGLILTLFVGGSVLVWTVNARRRIARGVLSKVAVAVVVVAVPAFGWMGYVNWRVTGHPLELPYMTHEATYAVTSTFSWQRDRPAPVYRHEVMRRNWLGEPVGPKSRPRPKVPHRPVRAAALRWLNPTERSKKVLFYSVALNPGILLAFAGLPFVLARDRWGRWAVAELAVGTGGVLLGAWMFAHYAAPLVGLVFLVAIMSTRELAARPWGRVLAMIILAVSVIAFVVEFRSSTLRDAASGAEWHRRRARIAESLRASGEPALVVVRYTTRHVPGEEWVYNDADIDRSPVVWAREMDASSNERLFRYFADRRIFLLEPDAPEPTLVPIEGAGLGGSARLLPRQSD